MHMQQQIENRRLRTESSSTGQRQNELLTDSIKPLGDFSNMVFQD